MYLKYVNQIEAGKSMIQKKNNSVGWHLFKWSIVAAKFNFKMMGCTPVRHSDFNRTINE